MLKALPGFVTAALSTEVVGVALKVSLVVGTLLAFINHGDAIVRLSLTTEAFYQIVITYFVPYGVSTYSSVKAIRNTV